jgi:hypothetical protein
MKITKIEFNKTTRIFIVIESPNGIERFFGVKEKVFRYKDTGGIYKIGGGHEYVDELGVPAGVLSETSKALDNWRRRF